MSRFIAGFVCGVAGMFVAVLWYSGSALEPEPQRTSRSHP